MKHVLKKVYNENCDDWYLKISTILWDYCTTCKWLTWKTPFTLVYGKEPVMPMEYVFPSLRIIAMTWMSNEGALE